MDCISPAHTRSRTLQREVRRHSQGGRAAACGALHLRDDALIGRVCNGVALPVNVTVMDGVPSNDRLSELGVSRISYGPIPYIRAMGVLQQDAKKVLS